MKILSSSIFWIIAFTFFQVMTYFIITGGGSEISPVLGFPNWLVYFIGLEIIFSISFYFFIKFYWRVES